MNASGRKRQVAIEIIAFLFIVLFLYAAVNKLVDYGKFKIQIGQSPLLTGLGNMVPWLVILLEVLVSIALAIPRIRRFAFFSAYCLMAMFTTYIVAILNFASSVPCSCGGILERMGWTEHLIFNIAFLVLGGIGFFLVDLEYRYDIHRKAEQV